MLVFLQISHHYGFHDDDNTIDFVVADGRGCAFSIPLSASLVDLHRTATEICNVSSAFGIQFMGKIIANSQSNPSKTINDIPNLRSMIEELNAIWGPKSGYRIPFRLRRPIPSEYDWAFYFSLLRMFPNPSPEMHNISWFRFIKYCVDSRSCLVQDICDIFKKSFYCDRKTNTLISMTMQRHRIHGEMDLTATPPSVRRIETERNQMTAINGIGNLCGKELAFLDIRDSPLELDLNQLISESHGCNDNPLRVLRVSLFQISRCLIGRRGEKNDRGRPQFCDEVYQAAEQWIQLTALDCLIVGRQLGKSRYIQRRKDGAESSKPPPIFRLKDISAVYDGLLEW